MKFSRKTVFRLRIMCVAASIAGLVLVVRQIQVKALAATFHDVQWGWILPALLLFGFLFVPAAVRWQLALRANNSFVTTGTAWRISLIGHFFYTILFGAPGGDAAKSALYTRWYRVPLTHTLAASSLDRLLGFGGLILFMVLTFGFAATQGAFNKLGAMSLRWPVYSLVFFFSGLTAFIIWLKHSPPESSQARFVKTFLESGRRLMKSPSSFSLGVSCGVAVQLALSGVLAFSLAAVSHDPIPWTKLAWTFPVISIISALPVTFAGLGVRDSAAVVLFGLYLVPASEAVAASLLTAAINLSWTVAGAGVLWREVLLNEPDFQLRTFLSRDGTALASETERLP